MHDKTEYPIFGEPEQLTKFWTYKVRDQDATTLALLGLVCGIILMSLLGKWALISQIQTSTISLQNLPYVLQFLTDEYRRCKDSVHVKIT